MEPVNWPVGLKRIRDLPLPMRPISMSEMRKAYPNAEDENLTVAVSGTGNLTVGDFFTITGAPPPFGDFTYEVKQIEDDRVTLKIKR